MSFFVLDTGVYGFILVLKACVILTSVAASVTGLDLIEK